MEKSPEAFRTISEVADWLGVPTHVLRFWESRFSQVKPVKRAGGRRYYRPSDMALIGGIKRLLHDDGMTIRGVQKLLREQGVRHVAGLSQPLFDAGEETAGEVIDMPAFRPGDAPAATPAEERADAPVSADDAAEEAEAAEAVETGPANEAAEPEDGADLLDLMNAPAGAPEAEIEAPPAIDVPEDGIAEADPAPVEPSGTMAEPAPDAAAPPPPEPEIAPETEPAAEAPEPPAEIAPAPEPEETAEAAVVSGDGSEPPASDDPPQAEPVQAAEPPQTVPEPVPAPPTIPETPDVPETDLADDAPELDDTPALAARLALLPAARLAGHAPALRAAHERLAALRERAGG